MKKKTGLALLPRGQKGLTMVLWAAFAVAPTGLPSLSYAAGMMTSPMGAGARVQITPVIANGWANTIGTFFNSPTSDLSMLSSVLPHLSQLDLNDPAVRASIEPVTRQIQAAAAVILPASASSLKEASSKSQGPTGDALEKMEILNTMFRAHLSESQQSQAQEVSQFHRSLLAEENRAKLEAKIQSIVESWKRSSENSATGSTLQVAADSVGQKDVPNSKLQPANYGQPLPSPTGKREIRSGLRKLISIPVGMGAQSPNSYFVEGLREIRSGSRKLISMPVGMGAQSPNSYFVEGLREIRSGLRKLISMPVGMGAQSPNSYFVEGLREIRSGLRKLISIPVGAGAQSPNSHLRAKVSETKPTKLAARRRAVGDAE